MSKFSFAGVLTALLLTATCTVNGKFGTSNHLFATRAPILAVLACEKRMGESGVIFRSTNWMLDHKWIGNCYLSRNSDCIQFGTSPLWPVLKTTQTDTHKSNEWTKKTDRAKRLQVEDEASVRFELGVIFTRGNARCFTTSLRADKHPIAFRFQLFILKKSRTSLICVLGT